ncbi:MAG TPA: alpha/beta hydrolase [Burkholderiales bacterium]|jgi:acetyl esterase/lipase|nr:alpha/beta hydrolase [Burkholderiales bacterium]
MALFRGMDRAALDAAYNNRNAVADYPRIAADRVKRSEKVRAARKFHADLKYGRGARERLDVFPAAQPGAPVFAFIHGGYWQSNDKEASSFLVEGPLALGFSVALIEYTLAPEADIDQIVSEVGRAVDWLAAHARDYGADPARLFVSGHSAGGHLTASVLGKPCVAGTLPISGLFDLEPIRLCYLNEKLRLNEKSAEKNSPRRHLPARRAPTVVAVGAAELPELVRQSTEYAQALKAPLLALPDHDHFSVLEELARPEGALCRALKDLAQAPQAA